VVEVGFQATEEREAVHAVGPRSRAQFFRCRGRLGLSRGLAVLL
jgi:hypothetical protein